MLKAYLSILALAKDLKIDLNNKRFREVQRRLVITKPLFFEKEFWLAILITLITLKFGSLQKEAFLASFCLRFLQSLFITFDSSNC